MSISGWLLGHQSGVFNGQWVCDTCPENMQKAANRFGGGFFCWAVKGYFQGLAAVGRGCVFLEVECFSGGAFPLERGAAGIFGEEELLFGFLGERFCF